LIETHQWLEFIEYGVFAWDNIFRLNLMGSIKYPNFTGIIRKCFLKSAGNKIWF